MKCYSPRRGKEGKLIRTCEQCDYAADCEIRKEYLRLRRMLKYLETHGISLHKRFRE